MRESNITASNLKRHVESVHDEIKPFKCNIYDFETEEI